ncbi:gliding motility-associated C-terminal domain-containing protein [Pedobacter nyackensis]|uniref:gliding motility-associated C-terminal domain-containing protein n=1 Tax=Pedobacter nyackensis TaxID=475255 RepID=UPI00292FF87B|nr:gliding motility-associated C-terminal domain-containing protein [Pedobacter nyackensis]
MKQLIATIFTGISLFASSDINAQLKAGAEGIVILNETVFHTEGLTLVPSNNLELVNLNISKQQHTIIWPKFNSIQRRFQFSRPLTFQGELAMNYENIELNGNEAKNLALAYSKAISNNYKDFTLVKESVVNTSERYIGQLFTDNIVFADLTSVSIEIPTVAPYTELVANNMITPNGDGVNDTWIVKNIHLHPNNELKIYDREGRLVFEMIGYDNSWGGLFNGNPLPEDSYYYILVIDSGKIKKTGFISIVRE